MIRVLKKDYLFTSFSEVRFGKTSAGSSLLLRHDIDLSLEKALEMAEIEHQLNVSATYFLFLRSPFYNVFSGKEEQIIRRLVQLGHRIGLHFDPLKYEDAKMSQLPKYIGQEINLLEQFYQLKLDAVSFHRPLSLDYFRDFSLANYAHSYEPIFVEKFKYVADSRAAWRFGHPLESEAYKARKDMQILVHPIWWNEEDTEDVICLEKLKSAYQKQFDENLYTELKSFWDSKKAGKNE